MCTVLTLFFDVLSYWPFGPMWVILSYYHEKGFLQLGLYEKRAVYLNFPNLSDSLEIQGIVKEHGKNSDRIQMLWICFNASIPSFSIVFGHRANNPSGCFKQCPFLYLKNSSLTFLFQLETVISKAAALPYTPPHFEVILC